MIEDKPQMWIFIGPNGSGKSTLTKKFVEKGIIPKNYFNADDLKKEKNLSDLEAQQQTAQSCEKSINDKVSFAFETVGSHASKAELMKRAKENGFKVNLVFVCTQDPDINVHRVKSRVDNGGHPVPEDKIRSRYGRSMDLLKEEFKIADEAWVYNNSWENPILIGRKKENGNILLKTNDRLKWTQKDLETLVGVKTNKQVGMIISSLMKAKNSNKSNF